MSALPRILLSLALIFAGNLFTAESAVHSKELAETTLTYVSDYFAFMGTDESARVMFAFDTNRGRDGDLWQAEHLILLLHDDTQGWAPLEGQGAFENNAKRLHLLPDSPSFQFRRTPATGLTIVSPSNQLTLTIDPIPEHYSRNHRKSTYRMGSAPGTLEWEGRSIKGVVIYEHLWMTGFNRLNRNYPELWTNSYGLYLWIGNGPDHLYLHHQENVTRLSPLIGNQVGYQIVGGQGLQLNNLKVQALDTQQALGFYRWPSRLGGSWSHAKGGGSLNVQVSDIAVISNFVIGGLSMGVVTGQVTLNGHKQPVYGLAEMLM